MAWSQRNELAPSHPGLDGGLHHEPVPVGDGVDESVELLGSEGPALANDHLGYSGVLTGVHHYQAVTKSALKYRVQHCGIVVRGGPAPQVHPRHWLVAAAYMAVQTPRDAVTHRVRSVPQQERGRRRARGADRRPSVGRLGDAGEGVEVCAGLRRAGRGGTSGSSGSGCAPCGP